MRWSRVSYCALSLTLVLGAVSCGSSGFQGQDGSDALTMSFQEFNSDGLDQQDFVGNTSADVDVCPTICDFGVDGIFGDEVFEQFTQTHANAVFTNFGTADILLDTYTVSIPGAAIPTRTAHTAALLPAGRCASQPTRHCGLDNDCGFADVCDQTPVPIEILLFDFVDKQLIVGDQKCPGVDPLTGLPTPGSIVPQTYQVNVVFYGSDETGERFTVNTGLRVGFFDANNCDTSSSGG